MKKVLVSTLIASFMLTSLSPMALAEGTNATSASGQRSPQENVQPAPVQKPPHRFRLFGLSKRTAAQKAKMVAQATPATPPSTPASQTAAPTTAPIETAPVIAHVTGIAVDGNKEVPANEVLSQVNVKVGDELDQKRLSRDVQAIYELGYFTDVKVETEMNPGGARVIYRVIENPKVGKIDIQGNSIVPTDKILSLMETKEGKILNTKTLYADVTVINRYYDNELGYLVEPTHVVDLKMQPDGTLKLQLVEGMKINDVVIEGETVFGPQQLKPLVKTRPGELFNQNQLKEDTARIAHLYEDNDYILDTIKPSINKEKGIVTFHILEATVQEIRVEGNTKTQEQVVLRNIRTKPGEVMRKKKLKKDLERLNNLGFFESVNFEPEPGSAPGKVILVAKVKEAKTGLATLGLGYSGGGNGQLRAGITGAVSFAEKNLQGSGQSAQVQWQRGVNIDSLGLTFLNPAINPRQDSFSVNIFSQNLVGLEEPIAGTTVGSVSGFALYNDETIGASATFGRLLTDDIRGFVTVRQEYINITENNQSTFLPIGLGSGTINSIAVATVVDTRDDIFNPHRGHYFNVGVTGAGGPLGGTFDYSKIQAEWRDYVSAPGPKGSTIAMRLWGGAITGNAPITEFFFLGGTDTLRSLQDNSLFGTSFVLANLEYRFPVAKLKMLSGAVFGEAGNTFFNGNSANTITGVGGVSSPNINQFGNGILTDVGVGLRLVYPTLGLGVIRLDYAVGPAGGRPSVGIGQSF